MLPGSEVVVSHGAVEPPGGGYHRSYRDGHQPVRHGFVPAGGQDRYDHAHPCGPGNQAGPLSPPPVSRAGTATAIDAPQATKNETSSPRWCASVARLTSPD